MNHNISLAGILLSFPFTLSTPALADQPNPPADYQRVVPIVEASETVLGQDLVYPPGRAKITSVVVTLMPGEETGRHLHAVPAFGYILEGELAIAYEGGPEKVFRAGDGFLEAIHIWHNGRARGDAPTRILAVFIGSEAVPPVTRP